MDLLPKNIIAPTHTKGTKDLLMVQQQEKVIHLFTGHLSVANPPTAMFLRGG